MIISISQRSLLRDGFAVVPDVLSTATIEELRRYSREVLDRQTTDERRNFKFHGSMIPVDFTNSLIADVLANPRLLEVFTGIGFADPRWMSGYIISKPPDSPSLWWHQDWWAWNHEVSFQEMPPQLFVFYYLQDTDQRSGGLRVIPSSHRKRIDLHDKLPDAHGEEISRQSLDSAAHAPHPDEVSVNVRAGDVVIGDVRLLHATHANKSGNERTCITVWYLPDFQALPHEIKSHLMQQPSIMHAQSIYNMLSSSLKPLIPFYADADPRISVYQRTPPRDFRRAAFSQRLENK